MALNGDLMTSDEIIYGSAEFWMGEHILKGNYKINSGFTRYTPLLSKI